MFLQRTYCLILVGRRNNTICWQYEYVLHVHLGRYSFTEKIIIIIFIHQYMVDM